MKVRSMTGFARARRADEQGEAVVTLKSVNHRALDIHSHLAAELDEYDPALRAAIKRQVARGHLDLRVTFTPALTPDSARLNRPLLEAYIAAAKRVKAEYDVPGELDVNALLRVPGMIGATDGEEEGRSLEGLLLSALEAALADLNQFREREGTELVKAMRECCAAISSDAGEMESMRGEILGALRARVEERVAEILKGAPMEPQRLVQEAALLADRSDIAEEIARLKVHAAELDQLLVQGGEIGKKLDFLLQEMNRETTTILSKTSGLGELGLRITNSALDSKSQIEKIREQALNLE